MKKLKERRTKLTDEQIEMLADDYRRGAKYKELQEAYGIDSSELHYILSDLVGFFEDRPSRSIYTLEDGLALWLHRQQDIGKVLNEALLLYRNSHPETEQSG